MDNTEEGGFAKGNGAKGQDRKELGWKTARGWKRVRHRKIRRKSQRLGLWATTRQCFGEAPWRTHALHVHVSNKVMLRTVCAETYMGDKDWIFPVYSAHVQCFNDDFSIYFPARFEGAGHRVPTPSPLLLSPRRQIEIIWTSKLSPSSSLSQTISNLCQAARCCADVNSP